MRHFLRASLLLSVSLCAACDRPATREAETNRELAASVLKGLLAFPHSTLLTVETGQDAAQATLTAPAPAQTVAAWYRQMLRLNGWDLQNDGVTSDGGISIYAEKEKRPLWVTLKAIGPSSTRYTVMGAALPRDSVTPDTAQRSGSSMSSNRIQRR